MLIFLTLIDSDDSKERFIKIYNQYRRLMFYVSFQILANEQDAEDAVQEAFFSIAKNIERISDPVCTKTKNLVVIITERKALDILRKRKKGGSDLLDEDLTGYDFDYTGTDALAGCIMKLPARYREIILLKYYMGYELKEISEILGIKLNNAQRLDQRAKAKLKMICKAEGYDI